MPPSQAAFLWVPAVGRYAMNNSIRPHTRTPAHPQRPNDSAAKVPATGRLLFPDDAARLPVTDQPSAASV